MIRLYAELNRWRVTPWAWGQMDYMLSLADWVPNQTGIDPADDVRLTYEDRSSCQRDTGFLRDQLGLRRGASKGLRGCRWWQRPPRATLRC